MVNKLHKKWIWAFNLYSNVISCFPYFIHCSNSGKYHVWYLYWYGLVVGMKRWHIWWILKSSTYRGLNSKIPSNQSKKKIQQQQLRMILYIDCVVPTCLYACMTASGHTLNETTNGVLGYLFQTRVSLSSQTIWDASCWHDIAKTTKHNVLEVFY